MIDHTMANVSPRARSEPAPVQIFTRCPKCKLQTVVRGECTSQPCQAYNRAFRAVAMKRMLRGFNRGRRRQGSTRRARAHG